MLNLYYPQLHRMPDPSSTPGSPGTPTPGVPTPAATHPPLDSQVNPQVFTQTPTPAAAAGTPPAKPAPGNTDVEIKGDLHISRIAAMNGYGTYVTLWNENAALKAKRKNSHILFHGDKKVAKGDVIKVVDKPGKTEPAQTEKVNTFKVDTSQLFLRLKILDENLQPVGNFPYELNVGGKVFKGKIGNGFGTIVDGLIQEDIPKTATIGTLLITLPGPAATPAPGAPGTPAPATPPATPAPGAATATKPDQIKFTLHIGRLDPIQEQAPDVNCYAGVQARLNNLAFDCGKVDGLAGPVVKNAIQRFQRRMKILPEDGLPSAAVQEALFTLHDKAGAGPVAAMVVPGVGETAPANDQTIV